MSAVLLIHVLYCDFQMYCNYLPINNHTQDFPIVFMHNVVSKYVKHLAFDSMQRCAWSTVHHCVKKGKKKGKNFQ